MSKKDSDMPPSGYDKCQAEFVSDFLGSCVSALVRENLGLRDSKGSIEREIDTITSDLDREARPAFETGLLRLTRSFYEALLEDAPDGLEDLERHAAVKLAGFRDRILAIKVQSLV